MRNTRLPMSHSRTPIQVRSGAAPSEYSFGTFFLTWFPSLPWGSFSMALTCNYPTRSGTAPGRTHPGWVTWSRSLLPDPVSHTTILAYRSQRGKMKRSKTESLPWSRNQRRRRPLQLSPQRAPSLGTQLGDALALSGKGLRGAGFPCPSSAASSGLSPILVQSHIRLPPPTTRDKEIRRWK